MTDFLHLPAVRRLKEQALNPIDLSNNYLTAKRIEEMAKSVLGLKLLYGTERVTDEVLKTLYDLSHEAKVLEKMEQMQKGEIVNRGEKRAALHTAVRGFFKMEQLHGKAKEVAEGAFHELEKLKNFMEKSSSFESMIQIGIGGSELGPKAIYTALLGRKHRPVRFFSSLDPNELHAVLKMVDLKSTLVAVVSKSGKTLETETDAELIREKFREAGLTPKDHMISVTTQGSHLDEKGRYKEIFYIDESIGGRYSVSSMVGAVPLVFAYGMETFLEFLSGAHEMDKEALSGGLPLLSALLNIWNRNFLHLPTYAIIPYSFDLRFLPAHAQQLKMESNGKSVDEQGKEVDFATSPIVWGEVGTNGQHSFFQLLHQGLLMSCIEFIGFCKAGSEDYIHGTTTSHEKLLANLFAQSLALAQGKTNENCAKAFSGNRPTRILLADELTPYSLGTILSYFEHQTVFEGFIWNINSFDQEGVELGKKLANQFIDELALKRAGKPLTFPFASAFFKHLS